MATDSEYLDPFNYKPLNRKDCMYLSAVSPHDEITKNLRGLTTDRQLSNNLTNLDISGNFQLYPRHIP